MKNEKEKKTNKQMNEKYYKKPQLKQKINQKKPK